MRWKFIDQFRGFAIFGMIFVNVCCEFNNSPYWLVHHDYGFTFADFVAPAFIFIVGFSYRLSFMKSIENAPKSTVRKKFLKRYIILTFLGFLYGDEKPLGGFFFKGFSPRQKLGWLPEPREL